MIRGVGIDSVEISRCAHWHTYSPERLKRLFCPEELEYCLSNPKKSAERFAARFAAKEAFYKALCALDGQQSPFITVARQVQVVYRQGRPVLEVDWACAHLSLTHTATTATAIVILEKFN